VGVFHWPNGNRYIGHFEGDARAGIGLFYWRDGTLYRGQFAADKMHGYGVKEAPEGQRELQHWQHGNLISSKPLREVPRCALMIDDKPWMFDAQSCINGLAHGSGSAASLDGERIVVEGRFVLGHLVEGDVQVLNPQES
jgi:hypothetical protein